MEKIPKLSVPWERIGTPIVEKVPPPIVNLGPPPVVNGIQPPIVNIEFPKLVYPTLPALPPTAPSPSSQNSPQSPGPKEKERESLRPQLPAPPVIPPPPQVEVPNLQEPTQEAKPGEVKAHTIEIAGQEITLPKPQEVAQASATAVVGTSATLVTAMAFNQVRRVAGDAVTKLKRDKFKIKLRTVRPVLHFVEDGHGNVEVIEYSSEGVRVVASDVESPEQFLRDTVEADELFEADHRIVIDDHLKSKFSREGAKRFNYFAPPKKMAKRLSARFIFG
jgi:hypothetical protein